VEISRDEKAATRADVPRDDRGDASMLRGANPVITNLSSRVAVLDRNREIIQGASADLGQG
jgi:hypothetical protein